MHIACNVENERISIEGSIYFQGVAYRIVKYQAKVNCIPKCQKFHCEGSLQQVVVLLLKLPPRMFIIGSQKL